MKTPAKNYLILENRPVGENTMMMTLKADSHCIETPGQFVEIAVEGFTLRRPISVFDVNGHELTVVYDIVGEGTSRLARMRPDEELNILPELGRGFDLNKDCRRPVLLGGGIGSAPLYFLAKRFLEREILPTVILGFRNKQKMILIEEFENLDIPFYVATEDGSHGTKGYVTDAIREEGLQPDYFYACGPMPMLKALSRNLEIPGQLSLEARMGCGFGVCMCCSIETVNGPKRICKEGPVFDKEELIWK